MRVVGGVNIWVFSIGIFVGSIGHIIWAGTQECFYEINCGLTESHTSLHIWSEDYGYADWSEYSLDTLFIL